MELEQLKTFVSLYNTRNFTRTAEELNIVQSTVTSRIKVLESIIGEKLFTRKTRSVEITAAGEIFYRHALNSIKAMEEGLKAVNMKSNYRETITIGALNSLWNTNLFQLLTQYSEQYIDINLRMITGHSYEIIPKIQNGTIDIGFVNSPPRTAFFESILYKEESVQLVGSPELVRKLGSINAEDLLKLPYIHFHWGLPFTDWFEEEIGRQNTMQLRADNLSIVLPFLLQGKGIGFLSDSITKPYIENGSLAVVHLQSTKVIPPRQVYIIFAAEKALKWRKFLEYIKQEVGT